MMDGINNDWGMGYGYSWIIGLIILIVVIVVIVSALRSRNNSKRIKYNSPHDILKIRYAKGEISKDEYDEKWKHIS
jgi:uncharacterized membrane protein